MSAIAVCQCGSIGASGVRLCVDHHRYWNGDKELTSVSRIIRDTWPLKKSFEAADPAVLEHARERGIRVDTYFQEYLTTGMVRIKSGEWKEVVDRLMSLRIWWENQHVEDVATQMILHNDEYAGTPDFVTTDSDIWDLKNVYSLDTTYWLQMGAYASLHIETHGHIGRLGLIHVNPRLTNGIQFVPVDLDEALHDWQITVDMWRMVKRRTVR